MDLHTLLAHALQLHQAGKLADAERIYRQILAAAPDHVDALHLLGALAGQSGHPEAAVELIRRAVALRPDIAEAHYNLGIELCNLDRVDEAIESYRRAVACRAEYADAHFNLARALKSLGRLDDSIESYRRALHVRPQWPQAWNNLGEALLAARRLEEANHAFDQAITADPNRPEPRNNLGLCLIEQGNPDHAIAVLNEVLEHHPDLAETHNNLALALRERGNADDAVTEFRRALDLKPDAAAWRSNLLLTLQCSPPQQDPASLFREHQLWAERHAAAVPPAAPKRHRDRAADRRLRIGYVSPDLREHSVSFFVETVLAHHEKRHFEIFCYSDVVVADATTARLRSYADRWVDLAGLSDERTARRIADDGIDVLVDLAGHTAGNRLRVFAARPAPVQVTYLGYPDTTGLGAIDWRLTDSRVDPEDKLSSERAWRLPRTFLCYTPRGDAPAVGPSARQAGRPVTFACFNNLAKVTRAALAVSARVLREVPSSALLLKANALGSAPLRREVLQHFEREGVDPSRVRLLGRTMSIAEHLACYRDADVALDTFPYNGTTTTCEALWMGLTVVTLAGETRASRVGASLLASVGLDEFVTRDEASYAAAAVALAADADRLDDLRRGMRERLAASPLLDGAKFTADLEHAYRSMWRQTLDADSPRD
jgi:predicted O-linked N-acetylglucosamine transferase (SPINDLY family)